MFFELRQYRTVPGKRDAWVKIMEERIIPGQTAAGATILGSFVGTEEEDLYVWIRRFESEGQFEAFRCAYYESDEWKNELQPMAREMLANVTVTRIEATPQSAMH